MKRNTGIITFIILSVLFGGFGRPQPSSYASPAPLNVSILEPNGTFHPAPGYHFDPPGPEYSANPPTIGRNDTYVEDEVILRFRPEVPAAQQTALMVAHGMRVGRPIYGERAFVTKVAVGRALTVANALRDNPLLDVVGVNPVMRAAFDPNDPRAPEQQHLDTDHINARQGWDYGQGLGAVSLVAILDSGIDMGGPDNIPHPEFTAKYKPENWVSFTISPPERDDQGHGTHVGGLATASTHNMIGVAGVGFSAWPMSVKVYTAVGTDPPVATLDRLVAGVNWASGHGASVINITADCDRGSPGCSPSDTTIQLLKAAVDVAYARGISVVVCAHNQGNDIPRYPAAFGQLTDDDLWWPYNEKLVIAVPGTKGDVRHPSSNYGTWVDFAAPYSEDNGDGILSTLPTDNYTDPTMAYGRDSGTSMSTPQVAGLAVLLQSLGYTNDETWDHIQHGITDLGDPGYDPETGWGRIDVGRSMSRAARPHNGSNPGMVVVPNAGRLGVQTFNFQASGFNPGDTIDICWTPPGGPTTCDSNQSADPFGAVGLGIQGAATAPTGVWTGQMCDQHLPPNCSPIRTFTVEP